MLRKAVTAVSIASLVFRSSLSGIAAADNPVPVFGDLEGHWSKSEVEYLVQKGIVDGVQQNGQQVILPDKSITRAEYIKLLVSARQVKLNEPSESSFPDVASSHWALKYIEAANANGWTDGYEDGTFKPDNQVSRAEIAVLMVRSYNLRMQEGNPVVFEDTAGHWANHYVNTAASNKIVEGDTVNGKRYFYPEKAATRAEGMAMLTRYLKTTETAGKDPKKETPAPAPSPTPAPGPSGTTSGGSSDSGSDSSSDSGTQQVTLDKDAIQNTLGGGKPVEGTDELNNKIALVGLDLSSFGGSLSDISVKLEKPNTVFSQLSVPGLTGPVIEFSTNGKSFASGTLTFNVAELSNKQNLAAAYYNETTKRFEFLPTVYNADQGTLSFTTTHNSKYVLIDKTSWEQTFRAHLSTVVDGTYKPYIDFAFIIDSSGSMGGTDPKDLRKTAVTSLVYGLKHDAASPLKTETVTVAKSVYEEGQGVHFEYPTVTNQVYSLSDRAAIIDFDNSVRTFATFSAHSSTVSDAVYHIDSDGGTNIFAGVREAVKLYDTYGDSGQRKIALLLTDGQNNYATTQDDLNLLKEAFEKGITIITMGLSSQADISLLKQIAEYTGGMYFQVQTAEDLQAYFKSALENSYHEDKDQDGLDDFYEKTTGMMLENGMIIRTSTDPVTGKDTDGDGFTDLEEMGEPVDMVVTADMVPADSTLVGKTVKVFKNFKSLPTDKNDVPKP
ncbi:S-layer homology domain-containing protein [Paenibacillus ehimensis]|uniref:S-layer homology domain-containing protein n=1 Tax=Paenibacillus ehimensis TaxID=79264 RepID=UPI003D2ABC42